MESAAVDQGLMAMAIDILQAEHPEVIPALKQNIRDFYWALTSILDIYADETEPSQKDLPENLYYVLKKS